MDIDIIKQAIFEYKRKNFEEPSGVLVHLDIYRDLCEDIGLAINHNDNCATLFGLKLYRTFDLEPGKFELLWNLKF